MKKFLKSFSSLITSGKKRYVYIAFFLFIAIVLVEIASIFIISYTEADWERISEEKTKSFLTEVVATFRDRQEELSTLVRNLAQDNKVLSVLTSPDKEHRLTLFSQLTDVQRVHDVSIAVYDQYGGTLAWVGRAVDLDSSQILECLRGKFASVITRGAIYSYLSIVFPVQDENAKTIGVVAVSRALEANYPLNNRFLHSTGLAEQLSKKYSVNVRFDFSLTAEESKDGRIASAELHGIDGKKLGMVYVNRPVRSIYLQDIQQTAETMIAFFVTTVSLFLFYFLHENITLVKHRGLRIVIFSLLLWGLRYLWLAFKFPSAVLPLEIFDPIYYASPFGFGLEKSMGEFFISTLFLFINTVYIFHSSVKFFHERKGFAPLKMNNVIAGIIFLIVGIFFLIITRGYASTIWSAMFDSTLKYNDPTSIVPYPLLGFMLFIFLLLTISYILLSAVAFLFAFQNASGILKNFSLNLSPWIVVFLVFTIESVFYGILRPNLFTTQVYRLILIFLFAVSSRYLTEQTGNLYLLYSGKNFLFLIMLSIIISTPLLDEKIHERDREYLETYASELTHPVNTWLKLVLDESLNQMQTDDELLEDLESEDPHIISGAAFKLWAKSTLSREGFNCSVALAKKGTPLSLFNIGMQSSDALKFITTVGEVTEKKVYQIRSSEDYRSLTRYYGIAPIFTERGEKLADVIIVLMSGQNILLRSETPEILQASTALNLETQFRDLVVSEYANGKLVSSTGEDFNIGYHVPQQVYQTLNEMKSSSAWVTEDIGEKAYESLYTVTERNPGNERLLALSLEKLDIRWHVFNLLKIVFFYLLLGSLVGGMYLGYRLYQEKNFHLSFRGRLLTSFLTIAILPLMILVYYDKDFTEESRLEILRHQLSDELGIVKTNLLAHLQIMGISEQRSYFDFINNTFCEQMAQEVGIDFNVYKQDHVQASSRPELFQAELIDDRISSDAYLNIFLIGKNFYVEHPSIGKFSYLEGYLPLEDNVGERVGAISVFTVFKHRAVDAELFKRSAFIFGMYAIAMLLVAAVGVFFANRISSPVKKLTEATRRVSSGELDLSLEVESHDEFGELVQSFNKMAQDLKRIQKELATAERELAWREMAKQVAHEIKNPLTPMKLSLQHLEQAYRDKARNFGSVLKTVTKTVMEQIEVLSRIASEFSRFARMPKRNFTLCDINTIAQDALDLFLQEPQIGFHPKFGDSIPQIFADEEELRRAFINLLRNSVQAVRVNSGVKGRISIQTRRRKGTIEIKITDNGCGISDENKARLFEPNFSTKTDGMGMGLALVKQTVEDLRGQIHIESQVGKGTTVSILLPVSDQKKPYGERA